MVNIYLMLRFLVPSRLCFPMLHLYVFAPYLYTEFVFGLESQYRRRNGHTRSRTHSSTPHHPEEEGLPLLVALSKGGGNFCPRNP